MTRTLILVAAIAARLGAQNSAPDYTPSTLVNGASFAAGSLAPNTIATLFGVNLAAGTWALRTSDLGSGRMPTYALAAGTNVLIGGISAPLYYASPGQVNFLVPANMAPGDSRIVVQVSGANGPSLVVHLATASPGIFITSPGRAAATDTQGNLISDSTPAKSGDWVILYATGLGECNPAVISGQLATSAASTTGPVTVLLGGLPLQPGYAGLTPGFAGLYQVNFQVPDSLTGLQELQIQIDGYASQPGVFLPIRTGN